MSRGERRLTGRWWRAAIALAAIAVFAASGIEWARLAAAPARQVPTARVQKGRVQVTIHSRGELRAGRSSQLVAPPVGGNVQIVKLAQSGEAVKAGDIVIEFDSAEQAFNLEQAHLDLDQADEEMAKADADAAVQRAQDDVALLHARFDVRRAALEAKGNELLSAIQARENLLLLEEARKRLAQLEQDMASHRETSRAASAVALEKHNKAQLAVQVAERNIASLQIRTPFDGYMVLRTNFDAMGFCCPPGMTPPDFRVGDSVGSGRPIADVVDTSRIEVSAKIPEQDRANVSAGQHIEVAVDALPDVRLNGTVRSVAGVATRQTFSADAMRRFDVVFDVSGDRRVRPGATAEITIAGPSIENALYIPRQAVFDALGHPTVYVRSGGVFESRDVRVRSWTESLAVVENLEPGLEVALVNPNTPSGSRPRAAQPAAPPPQRASR